MLVSVMMPAYNASQYINEAIESMQAQEYIEWELIIVDDGSKDTTYEAACEEADLDERIQVYQTKHQGCPATRNECLNYARGDIIARLDADDTHDPERLFYQVTRLQEGDVDIVTCGMNWLKGSTYIPIPTDEMHALSYLQGTSNGPPCASIVTRREIYDRVGPFNVEQLAGSDGDWNFRAVLLGLRWAHYPNHWYNQRRHSQQLSQRMKTMQRSVHEAARKRARGR